MDAIGQQLATNVLTYFKQGEYTLAMCSVDLFQAHYEESGMSALDRGRILMELAYEMARRGFNSVTIEQVLEYATVIAGGALTGNLEVHIVACRIRLLKGDPFGARMILEKMLELLPEGLALETIDESLACRLYDCIAAIRRATDEIYRNQGVSRTQ